MRTKKEFNCNIKLEKAEDSKLVGFFERWSKKKQINKKKHFKSILSRDL